MLARKKGEVVTFHEAINWMLEQNDLSNIDGHYKLQSEYCNLHSHINDDYTIIGRMEKGTLISDPTCIMEHAGLSRFNRVRKGSMDPYWHGDARTAKLLGGA